MACVNIGLTSVQNPDQALETAGSGVGCVMKLTVGGTERSPEILRSAGTTRFSVEGQFSL